MTSRPIGPSEDTLCKCRFATGIAMTVGMTMVLPPSHSLKQWGWLCQSGSWGETPVRWYGTPPYGDFLMRAGVSGTDGLCQCILVKDVTGYFVSLRLAFCYICYTQLFKYLYFRQALTVCIISISKSFFSTCIADKNSLFFLKDFVNSFKSFSSSSIL